MHHTTLSTIARVAPLLVSSRIGVAVPAMKRKIAVWSIRRNRGGVPHRPVRAVVERARAEHADHRDAVDDHTERREPRRCRGDDHHREHDRHEEGVAVRDAAQPRLDQPDRSGAGAGAGVGAVTRSPCACSRSASARISARRVEGAATAPTTTAITATTMIDAPRIRPSTSSARKATALSTAQWTNSERGGREGSGGGEEGSLVNSR